MHVVGHVFASRSLVAGACLSLLMAFGGVCLPRVLAACAHRDREVEQEFGQRSFSIGHKRIEQYVKKFPNCPRAPTNRGVQWREHEVLVFETAKNYVEVLQLSGRTISTTRLTSMMEMAYIHLKYPRKDRQHLFDKFMKYAPEAAGYCDHSKDKDAARVKWTVYELLREWHEL